MDRFKEMSAFVAVAEEEAFNGAAKKLNLSPSVVTRVVNSLEDRLGARLFTRTTRSVVLTEAGQGFYQDARRILENLSDAEALASGIHQRPRGRLTMTAPILFGQIYLMPIVNRYMEEYSEIEVTSLFLDRIVHLVEEGIDVALRIGDLPDSSLYARQVGHVRHVTVASPSYLEKTGIPGHPKELINHSIINSLNLHPRKDWQFVRQEKNLPARIDPRLTVNTATSAIDAALSGSGITRVLSYQLTDRLKRGKLVEILPEWEDRKIPVQIVFPEGRQAPAKTRAFVEFAAEKLREIADEFAAN